MVSISSISTQNKQIPAARNHPFNASFQATMEGFRDRGINIATPNGFRTVGQDINEFGAYKQAIFGDIQNESTRNNLETLMDHARDVTCYGDDQIADESGSIANVSTFSYLNGPVIRAIWARSIVPTVMRAVTLKQPSYTATFDIPYMVVNGVRKDLPYSMVDSEDPVIGLTPLVPKVAAGVHINADGSIKFTGNAVVGNLITESIEKTIGEFDGYAVDRRCTVKEIKISATKLNASGTAVDTTVEVIKKAVKPSTKTGKAGEFLFMLDVEIPVDTVADGKEMEQATIMVVLDMTTGRYRATATSNRIISFMFDAFLSAEDNRTPAMLRTEQHSIEVMIGTGQHIMIDTPVELLQEYPTAHQGSDYVVAATDIISEVFAGNMNQEMLRFYRNSLTNSNASSYIPDSVLRGVNKADAQFDIRVAHGENPSAYVDQQLKKCISYYINEIRSLTRIEDGFWSIVGHANNIALIPDFKTESFASINEGEDGVAENLGFKVGYTLGFTTNVINGKVRCLYTPEIKKERGLVCFFSSTDDKRPTYLFHPFSYTVSRGYQNPTNNTLPSIMVTKRHTFEEFVPSQFNLSILGNNDAQWSAPKSLGTP